MDNGKNGGTVAAYFIDDFITIGDPDSFERKENAVIMHSVCNRVGLPQYRW
jgi:hypothetical protein